MTSAVVSNLLLRHANCSLVRSVFMATLKYTYRVLTGQKGFFYGKKKGENTIDEGQY